MKIKLKDIQKFLEDNPKVRVDVTPVISVALQEVLFDGGVRWYSQLGRSREECEIVLADKRHLFIEHNELSFVESILPGDKPWTDTFEHIVIIKEKSTTSLAQRLEP